MSDRTVKVRLEADISDFVSDIGVKAVAAVNKLERAAGNANTRIRSVGADTKLPELGTKADTVGEKLKQTGTKGETSGKKIAAGAAKAKEELEKLTVAAKKVNVAAEEQSKAIDKASKSADSHANAIGRLRVAQLRLAQAQQKSNPVALAGAEESVKSAERAVKKLEKAAEDSGRSFGARFGAGVKRWFVGDGTSVLKQLGQNTGNGFLASLMGALKTPVIGPALLVALIAAATAAAGPVGAVLAGGIVTAFGAGLGALGLVFAAKSLVVKSIWAKTVAEMGAETRQISKPFEATLSVLAVVARRTFATFKPELAAAFKDLAPVLSSFGDQLGQALGKLAPAIQPLARAFAGVLGAEGPALNDMFSKLASGLTKLSESISKNPTALADFTRGLGGLVDDLLGFLTIMNNADAAFKRFTGGVSAVSAFMGTLRGAVGAVLGPLELTAQGASKVGDGMNWLAGKLGIGKQVMDQSAESTGTFSDNLLKTAASLTAQTTSALHSAHANHEANVQAALAAGAFDRQTAATNKLLDALNRVSSVLLSQKDAQLGYAQAVADANAAIKQNGKTHADNTQKGRDNQRALLAVAQAAITQRDSMIKANAGTAAAAKTTEAAKANFIKLAQQMGYGSAEARKMADDLIKIPNVSRTAKLNANIKDLEDKLATAKQKLKDPNLTKERKAELTAQIAKLEAGIARAKQALNSVPPSKNVSITTTYTEIHRVIGSGSRTSGGGVGGGHEVTGKGQADGGFYPGGVPAYANGKLPDQAMIAPGKGRGMVQWAEQETGGEAFIPLAPSKRDRSEKILGKVAENFGYGLVKSFANGGINLANGQLVDITYLLQQLGLPFDPTAGANYRSTLTNANRANRAVIPARNNAIAADRAEQSAKAAVAAIQRQIQLEQRAIAAARAPKQTTKAGQKAEDRRVAAEQKKLIALQDDLYAAKNRVTKATKASNAADAVLKIRQEAAAKAAQLNRDALEKLVQQQQAAVDLAKQVSDSLQGPANIGDLFQQSLTGKGLLADLQSEGADLKQFGQLIAQLRAKKLDADLINQIIGKGADQGGELAQAILDGGQALVNSLNTAQQNLENQANLIGAGVANDQYNTKVAGHRAGGGGVQAGRKYGVNENGMEWFVAPVNGDIVPAGVKPRQYIRDMAGAGVGGASRVVREVHHHHSNSFYGMSMDESNRIAQKVQALADFQSREY
ncbi:MAG TPA: hypothetical protein VGL05_19485 [Kribbella sp.]